MSSSVEDGLQLVRNKSHVSGSVSEFGLGLGSEVQMRTSRQEFWTHVTLGLPEPLLRLPKPRQFLLVHPRMGVPGGSLLDMPTSPPSSDILELAQTRKSKQSEINSLLH